MNVLLIFFSAISSIIFICLIRKFSDVYVSVKQNTSIGYLDGLIQDSSELILSTNECTRSWKPMETTELVSLSYEWNIISVTGKQPLTPFQIKVFQSVARHIETEVSKILLPGSSLLFQTNIRYEKDIMEVFMNDAADNQCTSLQPCRKLRIIFYLPTQLPDAVHSISEGYMLSEHSCAIPLTLQNTAEFDPMDVDTVFSATALASQCIRHIFNTHSPSTVNTHIFDINPEADMAFISSTEAQCLRSQHNILLVSKAIDKFKTLVQLHKYHDVLWSLVALSHTHREKVQNILRMLSELRSILDSKLHINSEETEQQMACQNPEGDAIQSLAFSILQDVLHLEMNPEWYLQASMPLEQHFAVFGPYWLPLMVPISRAIRLVFSDT